MSKWGDEETTTEPTRFGVNVNKKWDDEEDDDVLESWDAAEDSEEEKAKAEKAKKAAEAAAAARKPKGQRIAERQAEHAADKAAEEARRAELENETPEERRKRLQEQEIAADLNHAVDLFGGATVEDRADHGVSTKATHSTTTTATAAVAENDGDVKRKAISVPDPTDKSKAIDLSTLPLFNPTTKKQFQDLQDILAPLLSANVKKAHYPIFVQELMRLIIKDMGSDQIRKAASVCTTLANEKLREEKAAEKGTKKTKAQKTKTTLVGAGGKDSDRIDTKTYDDFDDDDFM